MKNPEAKNDQPTESIPEEFWVIRSIGTLAKYYEEQAEATRAKLEEISAQHYEAPAGYAVVLRPSNDIATAPIFIQKHFSGLKILWYPVDQKEVIAKGLLVDPSDPEKVAFVGSSIRYFEDKNDSWVYGTGKCAGYRAQYTDGLVPTVEELPSSAD